MSQDDKDSASPEREREVLEEAFAKVLPGEPVPGWLVHRMALSLQRCGDVVGELRLLEAYRRSHGDSIEGARFHDRELELRRLIEQ